jgi:hypothetical protein
MIMREMSTSYQNLNEHSQKVMKHTIFDPTIEWPELEHDFDFENKPVVTNTFIMQINWSKQ